ncbi:MAG: DNA repair protein RecO [Lachnospiraceae bacterium]|nr:DNA repair protein RecO [Lachnospiraceae bacterium]
MGDVIEVTGMVLVSSPIREYDKRIELLTRERGRISAFVQGARRPNSVLSACTIPFTFGIYYLYEGRNSYNVQSAQIKTYFDKIAEDFDGLCYASYFAEMAQYFSRENVEAPQELLLLYMTCKAVTKGLVSLPLIRSIYEMRLMQIEGEGLELFRCLKCGREDADKMIYFSQGGFLCRECASKIPGLQQEKPVKLSNDALYALQFILTTPIEKLYSFRVSAEVEKELAAFMKQYLHKYLPYEFKTMAFL